MLIDRGSILDRIYTELFSKEADATVNVFLCGARTSGSGSIRGRIYEALRNAPRVSVVYAEWLFADLLVRQQYDLLNLEHELAGNVDMIILPLEGTGTIAELGAFASFEKSRRKVVVINNENYKWKKSFVNLGPIKLIRAENSSNVVYYQDGKLDEVVDKIVSRVKYMKKRESKSDVTNLFNLARFMLFLVAIFQPISKDELTTMLLEWKDGMKEYHIEPCLNILVRNARILSNIRDYEPYFRLTPEGHRYVFENLLPNLKVTKPFGDIRTEVISNMYVRPKGFNPVKERERLLGVS